jgi:hypothetical protein
MPRSRSIFIQSERVWIGRFLGLHLAGELDRAAEQQQLFGQRRLAGVRVRDDREGAALGDLIGGGHVCLGRRRRARKTRGGGSAPAGGAQARPPCNPAPAWGVASKVPL